MIIFSPRKLETALRTGELTPWEKTKYLILAAVVMAFSEPFYLLAPAFKSTEVLGPTYALRGASQLLGVIITYFGIKYCYSINSHKESFIERFICLRVPWTVLFALILGPINLVILHYAKHHPETTLYHNISALIGPVTVIAYYYCLSKSFKRISE